jgi:hypothetical protein
MANTYQRNKQDFSYRNGCAKEISKEINLCTDSFTSPPKEGMYRKNPTASAGFEPANSGTRGQHANHQTTEAV